jgi:hypothetical protein
MKKGQLAKQHRINVCKHCGVDFNCFDKKASICTSCKEVVTFNCACGCGLNVSRVKYKSVNNRYYQNHDKRGKTYKDIYKTDTPGCGFKRGLNNVNFTKPKYKRFKYINSIGEKFSSTLEVAFSELLINNNITYVTEVKTPMINNRLKIVDFVINGVYVEVTGFAYQKWQDDFINKIKVLRKSINNPILILTYDHIIKNEASFSLLKQCSDLDVFFECVDNEQRILKKLKLFSAMEYINTNILKTENNICNCKK